VDAHLERDAVAPARDQRGIEEQGDPSDSGGGAGVGPQASRGPFLVRVHGEDLHGAQFVLGFDGLAQLDELAMADGSGVAVEEDQHDGRPAAEVGEADLLAAVALELEVGFGSGARAARKPGPRGTASIRRTSRWGSGSADSRRRSRGALVARDR
jgi:hypothetical protein